MSVAVATVVEPTPDAGAVLALRWINGGGQRVALAIELAGMPQNCARPGPLQAFAEKAGLVDAIGQDAVQAITDRTSAAGRGALALGDRGDRTRKYDRRATRTQVMVRSFIGAGTI